MPPPLKQQGRAPCYIWKEQPTGDARDEPHTVSVSLHQHKPQISMGRGFKRERRPLSSDLCGEALQESPEEEGGAG